MDGDCRKQYKTRFVQLLLGAFLMLPFVTLIRQTVNVARAGIIDGSDVDAPNSQPEHHSAISAATTLTTTNCRYGVATLSTKDYNFIQDLSVGWALNFTVNFSQSIPDGVEYTPMIRMKQVITDGVRYPDYEMYLGTPPLTDDPDGLGPLITANPGRLWLVGNEVDRIYWQDDMMPDVYAMAYHDVYHFIKERDPSAQVAVSGLVEVTPGRLQYLDIVWDSYLEMYGTPMPVDVWNFHLYILPEKNADGSGVGASIALGTDPDLAILSSGLNPNLCARDDVYCYAEHDDMGIFSEQVVAMRQWMKAHGQQNKPLVLSEYSLLYPYQDDGDTCYLQDEFGQCFTPERVRQFMLDSFAYLETAANTSLGYPADNYRLVQQWLWYVINDGDGTYFSSKLLEDGYTASDYTPTLAGETFESEVDGKRPFPTTPFIHQVSYPTAKTITPTGTVSVTIAADLVNNGDTAMANPITVTFYADEARTDVIGTAVIPAGLAGCARHSTAVQVLWSDLTPGMHPYWVEAAGGNTASGFVLINPAQIYLPVITRK